MDGRLKADAREREGGGKKAEAVCRERIGNSKLPGPSLSPLSLRYSAVLARVMIDLAPFLGLLLPDDGAGGNMARESRGSLG